MCKCGLAYLHSSTLLLNTYVQIRTRLLTFFHTAPKYICANAGPLAQSDIPLQSEGICRAGECASSVHLFDICLLLDVLEPASVLMLFVVFEDSLRPLLAIKCTVQCSGIPNCGFVNHFHLLFSFPGALEWQCYGFVTTGNQHKFQL